MKSFSTMRPRTTVDRLRAACLLLITLLAGMSLSHAQAVRKDNPARAPAAVASGPKAMLRVGCEGESIGAEVSVNGVFRGECPFDMAVNPGALQISAVKKGAVEDRTFETELRVSADTVKRVDIVLNGTRINDAGRKAETIRQEEQARRQRELEAILARTAAEERAEWQRQNRAEDAARTNAGGVRNSP